MKPSAGQFRLTEAEKSRRMGNVSDYCCSLKEKKDKKSKGLNCVCIYQLFFDMYEVLGFYFYF